MQQLTISHHRSWRPLSKARGFTLQELIVTVAISGTLSTGAVAMTNTVRDTIMTSAANELVTHFNLARTTAITQGADTVVCPSIDQKRCAASEGDSTPWQSGWLVYVDRNDNKEPDADEIVRVAGSASANVTIRSSRYRRQIAYHPSGTAGGSTITLAICDSRGAASARYVTISNTGRARLSRTTTSDIRCS